MSDDTPTSVADIEDPISKDQIVREAEEVSRGGVWSDENLEQPLIWAGEQVGKVSSEEKTPRLGGMGRPDKAYSVILRKFTAEELESLVEVVNYELMVRNAIPGRNLKVGLATMIANSEQALRRSVESKIGENSAKSGIDVQARQNFQIVENKLHEFEKILAERNRGEIQILEKATDVLAGYEAKKREEGIAGDELLNLIEERDHLKDALTELRGLQSKLPASGNKPDGGRRSTRRGALF